MSRPTDLTELQEQLRERQPAEIKPFLLEAKNNLIGSYTPMQRGMALANDLAGFYDLVIQSVLDRLLSPTIDYCCAAIGGYGRRELNIFSDVDLVFIYNEMEYAATEAFRLQINESIRVLWDVGLQVGHSVRTVQDYRSLADKDATVKTSILELRYVGGNQVHFNKTQAQLVRAAFAERPKEFLLYRLGVLKERHDRHGGSDRILEPHVKEGAGGFRDLHAVFWTGKVWLYMDGFEKEARDSVDCLSVLANLVQVGHLTSDYAIGRSLEYLMTTRNALHQLTGRQQDVLTYPLQQPVSRLLGYEDLEKVKGVESFMRTYYRHARNISHLIGLIRDKIRTAIEDPTTDSPIELKHGFQVVNRKLYFEGAFTSQLETEPAVMSRAFLYAQQYDVSMSESLQVLIKENIHRVDESFQRHPVVARDFLEIWKSEGKVALTLDRMHASGFLERYLPEFGYIVAHYNYNVYHYYTTDEHLIVAVSKLESLFFEDSADDSTALHHLRSIYDELTLFERYQLYWAVFLHDIGKSRGGDHSQIGVALARQIFQRLGYRDNADAVYFLILNHLVMEQTAFRRNLKDEETIKEFATLVSNRRWLRLLYLLTFADLSAANKSAWTDWKGILLLELFSKTDLFLKASETDSKFSLSAWERVDYTSIRLESELDVQFVDQSDFTEVLVVTSDVPFRLSQICGVMAASDVSIFDANVFTRKDGIVIDQFKVTDFSTNRCLSGHQKGHLKQLMSEILSGKQDIRALMERLQRRWKRRKINPNVETEVLFEDNKKFTIIDVFAPDRIGLLFIITQALSDLGLNIYSAKVGTRLDGAADCFYVLDQEGSKIISLQKQEEIRHHLLRVIEK